MTGTITSGPLRRVPILPTIVVGLAVLTMVALGLWQLGRAQERDLAHARMVERMHLPVAPYPLAAPADDAFLYRRLSADCDRVLAWETRAGTSVADKTGWRQIALCASGGGRARLRVDMGVAATPNGRSGWAGGPVVGRAVREPDTRGVAERFGRAAATRPLMIVAETPAPGLAPSRQPDPSADTNSSWSYTVQWFLFAVTALVIYALALRRRWRASPA